MENLTQLLQSKGLDPNILKQINNAISSEELQNCLKSGPKNDLPSSQSNPNLPKTEPPNPNDTSNNEEASTFEPQTPKYELIIKNLDQLHTFIQNYFHLSSFIHSKKCLNNYKYEISQILFPLFVLGYVELLKNDSIIDEQNRNLFFDQFSVELYPKYTEAINELSKITNKDQIHKSEFLNYFINKKTVYTVKVNTDAHITLLNFFNENENQVGVISKIIRDPNSKIKIEVINDKPRKNIPIGFLSSGFPIGYGITKSNSGSNLDENLKINSNKLPQVYYGIQKYSEYPSGLNPDDLHSEDEIESNNKDVTYRKKISMGHRQHNNKRKAVEIVKKFNKIDNNAPPKDRIPMDGDSPLYKFDLLNIMKDCVKRTDLVGGKTLPSILNYTLLNSGDSISANAITEDSSMYAHTIRDGNTVRVWTLTQQGLKKLRPAYELQQLSVDQIDIWGQIWEEDYLDPNNMHQNKNKNNIIDGPMYQDLIGHSGKVFAIAFSSCRQYIITAGEDSTIRLWSSYTWSCIVIFKGVLKNF